MVDLGFLFSSKPKACKICHDKRDETVEMEPTEVYDRMQRVYVSAWECPQCGHSVYREKNGEVQFTEP